MQEDYIPLHVKQFVIIIWGYSCSYFVRDDSPFLAVYTPLLLISRLFSSPIHTRMCAALYLQIPPVLRHASTLSFLKSLEDDYLIVRKFVMYTHLLPLYQFSLKCSWKTEMSDCLNFLQNSLVICGTNPQHSSEKSLAGLKYS